MTEVDVTSLLAIWKAGDRSVEPALIRAVYPTLQSLARVQLQRFTGPVTLQATELVNEAYERLHRQQKVDWQDRQHFFAIAATVIRYILIDHLRERKSEKRGGDVIKVELTGAAEEAMALTNGIDWLELDQALTALAEVDRRCVQVVEMRVFAGMAVEEVAQAMMSSVATVGRQWRFARAWLGEYLAA